MVNKDLNKISMNPDLLDPKEVMIGRLKSKIESFKRYDKERKKYYQDSIVKLGQLEALFDEIDTEGKLREKIKAQKHTISALQSALTCKGVKFPKDFDLTIAKAKIVELQNQVSELKEHLKKYRCHVSTLINKLHQYEINTTNC